MTFNQIWSEIGPRSQLGETRSRYLYNLLTIAKSTSPYGKISEVGVFQGITAKLMQLCAPDRLLCVFDTFDGIKGIDPSIDSHRDGDFRCDFDSVKKLLEDGRTKGKVSYHRGIFPETYPTAYFNTWMFVHSDTDTYMGSRATLDKFWPHMASGGIILFDDYANEGCKGVKKALDEWSESTGAEVLLSPDRWQAHVIKA